MFFFFFRQFLNKKIVYLNIGYFKYFLLEIFRGKERDIKMGNNLSTDSIKLTKAEKKDLKAAKRLKKKDSKLKEKLKLKNWL